MMKKLFTVLAAALILFSINGMSQGFTVKGTIDGVEDGKVTLQKRGGEKFKTGLSDGKFMLKGKIKEAGLFSLTVDGVRGGVSLFLENAEFTVKAKKTNNGRTDVITAEEITGGKAQKVFQEYQDLSAQLSQVMAEETKEFMEAYRANDEEKVKKLEPVYDAAAKKRTDGLLAFAKENNTSVVAAWIMQSQIGRMDDPSEIEALISSLDPSLANSSFVTGMKETLEIKKKTAIGVMAPDFTQNDPDGNPVSLSDFRGKVVLVDFWASWCGPCRKENPNVVAAYKKYNSKGFTVLGVSFDRPNAKDAWLKAIEDDNLTWTHVSDLQFWDNAVGKIYGIRSIPSSVLVDKDGKIIGKNLRGEDLHKKLKEVLK